MWLAERLSEKDYQLWQTTINTPPPEATAEVVEMTEAEEGQAFLAFAAAMGGGAHG